MMKKLLIILIYVIALISTFANMKYDKEIKDKEQYINELEIKIKEKDNIIENYNKALSEEIEIYFDECCLEY